MAQYYRLTREERYQIDALKRSEMSVREIARVLDREPSTILRELARNGANNYKAIRAESLAKGRRKNVGPKKKIDSSLKNQIATYLYKQWSPEQIKDVLRRKGVILSIDTIYRYIYEDQKEGGSLYLNLRRMRRWRRSHEVSRNYLAVGKRIHQVPISERPEVVKQRKRVGDFERDTVLGQKGTPILLTIVDRASRLTKIKKLKVLSAELTHEATIKLLKNFKVHTITNDNGPEFALHKKTSEKLKAKVYFSDPYSSWQRGTNENTNGLIRQYYPKGYDFNRVSEEDIKDLELLLNTRPRKCLGFKTPLEVHKKLSQSVALSTRT